MLIVEVTKVYLPSLFTLSLSIFKEEQRGYSKENYLSITIFFSYLNSGLSETNPKQLRLLSLMGDWQIALL